VGGMIFSPFMKNEGFSIALVVLPLLASLSKKYRNLVYLSFFPVGAIHHSNSTIFPIHFTVILSTKKITY
jgi:hypothetical protein